MTSTVPRVSSNDGDVVRFPFSAVVGHDDLRLALLLNAVHPGVGGVLVRGEKGTAKSTAVRALAALLPAVTVVPDCRFSCDPAAPDPRCPDGPHHGPLGVCDDRADSEVRRREGLALLPPPAVHARPARLVELPVGATEDRLVGSLDLERALAHGVRAYQPGLLAEAHRGVLYVDEVNLLHDHLVDLLLDAAAMGRAHVERDGVSVSHAASFLLVGTMNPEEGELRPQLLDRFGLTVEVAGLARRRDARGGRAQADGVRGRPGRRSPRRTPRPRRTRRGGSRTPGRGCRSVVLPDARAAPDRGGVRGFRRRRDARGPRHRPRGGGARGVARGGRRRRRRTCARRPGWRCRTGAGATRSTSRGWTSRPSTRRWTARTPNRSRTARIPTARTRRRAAGAAARRTATPTTLSTERTRRRVNQTWPTPRSVGPRTTRGRPATVRRAPRRRRRRRSGPGGSRSREWGRVRPAAGRGPAPTPAGSSVPPTGLRGAPRSCTCRPPSRPPHRTSGSGAGPAAGLLLDRGDLRRAEREGREGNLVLFAVDASGSMAARKRMSAVSGAVLSLLRDAYQRRDKVGLLTFRGTGAEVVLPPTSSVPTAQARLATLRTGGRTPLADGLLRARRLLAAERLRDPRRRPLLVVLTDGRATVAARPGNDPVRDACRAAELLAADGIATVVVDCEAGHVRLGLAAGLAAAAGASLVALADLSADRVAGVVHAARAA